MILFLNIMCCRSGGWGLGQMQGGSGLGGYSQSPRAHTPHSYSYSQMNQVSYFRFMLFHVICQVL